MKKETNTTDQQLEQLLHEADQTLNSPTRSSLSGKRLRHLAARRRTVKRGAVAAAMLAIVAAGVAWRAGNQTDHQPENTQLATSESKPEQPEMQASPQQKDLEEIRAEMQRIKLLTQQLRADRELTRARAELRELQRQPSPSEHFNQPIERAALAGVYLGDHWSRESSDPAAAREQFQFVVQHFPNTHWGEIARERLLAIDTDPQGDFK